MFNKNEFRAEVIRRGLTLNQIAEGLGISPTSLNRKMNGESDFFRNEIEKIIHTLHLSGEEVLRIFFAE